MKARALFDYPLGRWKAGEVGDILINDFSEKYDYFVDFGFVEVPDLITSEPTLYARQYYFYAYEIELVNNGDI